MLNDINLLEWIGYIGSVLVAISLTMSSILKLRWINLIGAAIFSVYGFLISALPVAYLNLFIVITNIYYLYKLYNRKEIFKIIYSDIEDSLVKYFIDFNKNDIGNIFEDFQKQKKQSLLSGEESVTLLMLRDAHIAGIVYGTIKDDKLNILLDYVLPQYRDLKPGDYIYGHNIYIFKDRGIKQLCCKTNDIHHQRYLEKMGFVREGEIYNMKI